MPPLKVAEGKKTVSFSQLLRKLSLVPQDQKIIKEVIVVDAKFMLTLLL